MGVSQNFLRKYPGVGKIGNFMPGGRALRKDTFPVTLRAKSLAPHGQMPQGAGMFCEQIPGGYQGGNKEFSSLHKTTQIADFRGPNRVCLRVWLSFDWTFIRRNKNVFHYFQGHFCQLI